MINRPDIERESFRNLTIEQLRKWRDRVMEAIDTGVVNASVCVPENVLQLTGIHYTSVT